MHSDLLVVHYRSFSMPAEAQDMVEIMGRHEVQPWLEKHGSQVFICGTQGLEEHLRQKNEEIRILRAVVQEITPMTLKLFDRVQTYDWPLEAYQ